MCTCRVHMTLASAACSSLHSFFFNDTATTEIYTLSLHDALPILYMCGYVCVYACACTCVGMCVCARSEEHTSELQSHLNLVCRLLLEKTTEMRACGRPAAKAALGRAYTVMSRAL